MALSKRETAEHIINNPNLSDPVKLKFLNELGPLDEPGAAISQGGSFLSAEDMKPKASSPPTKSAQQDEGTGYGGAILRGLFRTPGLMVAPGLAAAESILEKLGVIDPLAPGDQSEAQAAPDLLVPKDLKEPTRFGPRIAERAVEEIAGASPWMRASRGVQLLKDIGTAGAMGTGAGLAREVLPGSLPAEIVGQLSGLAGAKGMGMASRLFPSTREAAASAQVQRMLGEQIGSPARSAAEIQKTLDLGKDFPGFQPPLGTASQDPGLLAIERQARVTSPQTEVKIQEQLGKSREALRAGLKGLDEPTPSSPAAVETAAQAKVKDFEFKAQQLKAQVDQNVSRVMRDFDQRVASLNPTTRESAGELARYEITMAKEQARKQGNDLYEAVPAIRKKPADVRPLQAQIDALRKEVSPAEMPGPDGMSESFPTKLVEHIDTLIKQPNVTFGTIKDLRRTVGYAKQLEETKLAPDTVLLGRLSRLQAALEESLSHSLLNPVYTHAETSALNLANQFWKDDVIGRFEQGPVSKLWRSGARGEESRLKDSQIITTFFHSGPGAAEDARAFRDALGPSRTKLSQLQITGSSVDKGTDLFRQAALSDLRERVMNVDGTLDPSRFASWIRQYKPALQVFPPVWKELQTLQAAQASIKTLQSAAEALPKAMRSPLEAESEGARLLLGKPVDTAVRQALQDAHPHERVQEMMRLTGNDPAAVMGLRRQVWKELTERMKLNAPADVLWSEHAQPVAQIVKQYRPLLEQLYPPEHLKTLEKLAIGESILERAPQAVKMANADIMKKSGISGFIGTFWSRMFGVSRGVVGEPFLMTEGLSRGMVKALEGISQEKQREILEHAILDKDLMKTLTSLVEGTRPETVNQRLNKWLEGMGKYGVTLGMENRIGHDKPRTVPAKEAVVSPGTVSIPEKISKAEQAKGLPPGLAKAVAKVESGMDQSKVGSKDDVGVFQLTPIGAKDVGLGLADRRDLDKNIAGGTDLLGKMLKRYNGDTAKALAAYNAGPTAVDNGKIPASTNAYVAKVMTSWRQDRDQKRR